MEPEATAAAAPAPSNHKAFQETGLDDNSVCLGGGSLNELEADCQPSRHQTSAERLRDIRAKHAQASAPFLAAYARERAMLPRPGAAAEQQLQAARSTSHNESPRDALESPLQSAQVTQGAQSNRKGQQQSSLAVTPATPSPATAAAAPAPSNHKAFRETGYPQMAFEVQMDFLDDQLEYESFVSKGDDYDRTYDDLKSAQRRCQDNIDELGLYRKGVKTMTEHKANQLLRNKYKDLGITRRKIGIYRANKVEQLTYLRRELDSTIKRWRNTGVDQRDIKHLRK